MAPSNVLLYEHVILCPLSTQAVLRSYSLSPDHQYITGGTRPTLTGARFLDASSACHPTCFLRLALVPLSPCPFKIPCWANRLTRVSPVVALPLHSTGSPKSSLFNLSSTISRFVIISLYLPILDVTASEAPDYSRGTGLVYKPATSPAQQDIPRALP